MVITFCKKVITGYYNPRRVATTLRFLFIINNNRSILYTKMSPGSLLQKEQQILYISITLNISIQSKGGTPIYEQIATQIKEAILAGKLNKDDALPSIRALSADIKVSVITTKKAYEELEKEKMIYSVPGKGFFVDDPDMAYLEEKRTLSVEEELAAVIEKAKAAELDEAEFIDMVRILWEEETC